MQVCDLSLFEWKYDFSNCQKKVYVQYSLIEDMNILKYALFEEVLYFISEEHTYTFLSRICIYWRMFTEIEFGL